MKTPTIVVLPPCKPNLKYTVLPYGSIVENFTHLLERLRLERVDFPRTIIYCRQLVDCSSLYLFFQKKLGRDFTEPPGFNSLSQFQLVEMFTSCTDSEVKSKIITSFMQPSKLRLVCAIYSGFWSWG